MKSTTWKYVGRLDVFPISYTTSDPWRPLKCFVPLQTLTLNLAGGLPVVPSCLVYTLQGPSPVSNMCFRAHAGGMSIVSCSQSRIIWLIQTYVILRHAGSVARRLLNRVTSFMKPWCSVSFPFSLNLHKVSVLTTPNLEIHCLDYSF